MFRDCFMVAASHSEASGVIVEHRLEGPLSQFEADELQSIADNEIESTRLGITDITGNVNDTVRLALNLLLISVARPELLTGGEIVKRVKIKRGEGKREMWAPRWIGRDWKAEREIRSGTGSHASPRLHWRRGHYRRSVVGPRLTLERAPIPASQRAHEVI